MSINDSFPVRGSRDSHKNPHPPHATISLAQYCKRKEMGIKVKYFENVSKSGQSGIKKPTSVG